MFRKLLKKVQKRIVQASKLELVDTGALHCVLVAVTKNPAYRTHNKTALYTIAMMGMDSALQADQHSASGNSAAFTLAVELYCRVVDFAEESERLLRTISAIARQRNPPFEGHAQLLPLRSINKIGASVTASSAVGFLWRIYAAVLEFADQGLSNFLVAFE